MGNNSKSKKNARVVLLVHDTSSQCDACTRNALRIYSIRFRHGLLYWTKSRRNNSKMQEFSFLFMTHRLNVMHVPVKFHEYIPYGLGVMARTQSGTYGQTDRRTDVRDGQE